MYLGAAVFLGLSLILVPLYALGGINSQRPSAVIEQRVYVTGVENYPSVTHQNYSSEMGALLASFLVAMFVYLFVRSRVRRIDSGRVWMTPY